MWRACHNLLPTLLPTKDNLLRRKVGSDPNCPVCGLEAETVYHVLWGCPTTRDVWGASDRCFQESTLQGPKFIDVSKGIYTNHGKEALTIFIATAKQIWFIINELVHGGMFTHPNIVVCNTRVAMEEFQTINRPCTMTCPNKSMEIPPCWTAPRKG
jgi:hypothetical protein